MYTISYENERGNRIDFDRGISVLNFDGFGEASAEIQTQRAPYQDGARFVDSLVSERSLSIEFMISGNSSDEVSYYRRLLSQAFNPKLTGKLTVKISGNEYYIIAIPEHAPNFPSGSGSQGQRYQSGVIDLLAVDDPYWRNPNEVSKALRAYSGKFVLPTTFPIEFGITGESTILTNIGDVEAPVTIDIQGPVTNPVVINRTTGQYIRINRSLSEDEVLHIDTNDLHKRVEVIRGGNRIENSLGYLDHFSDFWKLQVGDNDIQYLADAGTADAIVAVAWKNRYIGI